VNQPPPNGHPRRTNRAQPGDQVPPPGAPGPAQQRPVPPPVVVPSLEVLVAEFEELVAANQKGFTELAAQGAAPDPFYLVHARINALIESIAQFTGPNGPRWAVMTRLTFERQIAAEIEQAGPATRRMQLAEGARYTPSMIAALARQTGTLRPRTQ
jgi:hypothetical protein